MSLLDPKKVKFTEIYSSYYQTVYGLIYSKITSETDADELSQEVFISFYLKMDGITNVRAWLIGAIKNILFNFYKKQNRLDCDQIEDYSNDVAISLVNGLREARIIIEEALQTLSEHDRILFDLIAVQYLTYERASCHTGMTVRQVKYRYYQILRIIRSYLYDKGINRIEDLI
jgi:RNA polymerase sigma factor (sigma-70 family)